MAVAKVDRQVGKSCRAIGTYKSKTPGNPAVDTSEAFAWHSPNAGFHRIAETACFNFPKSSSLIINGNIKYMLFFVPPKKTFLHIKVAQTTLPHLSNASDILRGATDGLLARGTAKEGVSCVIAGVHNHFLA
jgi:hypothetical protein